MGAPAKLREHCGVVTNWEQFLGGGKYWMTLA
jgi:hypothetical protein